MKSLFDIEMVDGTKINLHFSGHSAGRSKEREVQIDEIVNAFQIEDDLLDILYLHNGEIGVIINRKACYSFVASMNIKYSNKSIASIDIDIITIWNGTDILYSENEALIEIGA